MTRREYREIEGVIHHQCLTCHKWKPSTRQFFYGAGGARNRLRSDCITCRVARAKDKRRQRIAVSQPFARVRTRTVQGATVYTYEAVPPPAPTGLAALLAQLDA